MVSEITLLIDLHKDAERQGPGSAEETKRALELIGPQKDTCKNILDVGCGSGAQTLVMAEHTHAQITAVDLFPEFLKALEYKAKSLGYQDRIRTVQRSMDDLQFAEGEFDLIWSEGAIYTMGFREGLCAWKKFLKTGGYIAVSEISWSTGQRPKEVEAYWRTEYAQIDTVQNKCTILEQSGYEVVSHFLLPHYCWLDNYYIPMQKRFDAFLERNGHSDMAKEIVAKERKEIEIFNEYGRYYSYGFYIARKL